MNERDLMILAGADAREVMDQGLEMAQQRLTELAGREVTQREAAVKAHLEDFVRKVERNQTLEGLGVGREVYECARGLMRNPTFRKMIQEEAARIREEEAALAS